MCQKIGITLAARGKLSFPHAREAPVGPLRDTCAAMLMLTPVVRAEVTAVSGVSNLDVVQITANRFAEPSRRCPAQSK